MQNGWITMDKSNGKSVCIRKARGVEDAVRKHLQSIRDGKAEKVERSVIAELKKRKLISET
jgi:hypothetical protein